MEYLVQHRHVALTGSLKVQGTKRMGRRIANQLEFVDHRESRARHLSWIKTAAEGKAGRGRYGTSYELLIAVEDWWFGPNHTEEVVTFVEREVLTLPPRVQCRSCSWPHGPPFPLVSAGESFVLSQNAPGASISANHRLDLTARASQPRR